MGTKENKYQLRGSIHTVSVFTKEQIEEERIPYEYRLKRVTKINRQKETGTSLIVNLNSLNGDIWNLSEFEDTLNEVMGQITQEPWKVTRIDFRLDGMTEGFFDENLKLNRMLVASLALQHGISNSYYYRGLLTEKDLSVVARSNRLEAEYYNKREESNGTSEADARLELRIKGNNLDIRKELERWKGRVQTALCKKAAQALEDHFYMVMLEKWTKEQGKKKLLQFIHENENIIFSPKQLKKFIKIARGTEDARKITNYYDTVIKKYHIEYVFGCERKAMQKEITKEIKKFLGKK